MHNERASVIKAGSCTYHSVGAMGQESDTSASKDDLIRVRAAEGGHCVSAEAQPRDHLQGNKNGTERSVAL